MRRGYSAETVAQRAGIARKTLYRVESGDAVVALGIYARVLQALRLENGLAAIALDDELGRKLQDASLEPKRRAPKKSRPASQPVASWRSEATLLGIPKAEQELMAPAFGISDAILR